MTRFSKSADGKYVVSGHKYEMLTEVAPKCGMVLPAKQVVD